MSKERTKGDNSALIGLASLLLRVGKVFEGFDFLEKERLFSQLFCKRRVLFILE